MKAPEAVPIKLAKCEGAEPPSAARHHQVPLLDP